MVVQRPSCARPGLASYIKPGVASPALPKLNGALIAATPLWRGANAVSAPKARVSPAGSRRRSSFAQTEATPSLATRALQSRSGA
jgi:hypothetical protein